MQVLWVIGQAIERKAAGYSITLLQIHTIVHVVCALLMYALRLRKPLNVQRPSLLDFGDVKYLLALDIQLLHLTEELVSRSRPGLLPTSDLPPFLSLGCSQSKPLWVHDVSEYYLQFVWHNSPKRPNNVPNTISNRAEASTCRLDIGVYDISLPSGITIPSKMIADCMPRGEHKSICRLHIWPGFSMWIRSRICQNSFLASYRRFGIFSMKCIFVSKRHN